MQLFGKDLDSEIAIVAEIGVNHEGNPEVAHRLIEQAAEAGADAVKFQTFTPERYQSADDPARLERVRGFALDEATHRSLAVRAAELGIAFFSTPVTEDVIPFLAELCPAIKIASGDSVFRPTIEAAAHSGRPIILSTGATTLQEIERTLGWIRVATKTEDLRDRVVLMQCVSAYPTPPEQANVMSVPFLRERFELRVGYSNHVLGLAACYAAIAHGASLIEVHFTDCKEGREFRDHALSADGDDLRELVTLAPQIRASLGSRDKTIQPAESEMPPIIRKGIVAARDLGPGDILVVADLMFARPASEFDSNELDAVIGCEVLRPIGRGHVVARGDVRR